MRVVDGHPLTATDPSPLCLCLAINAELWAGLQDSSLLAAALRRRDAKSEAEFIDVSELDAFALSVHPWGVAGAYNGYQPRVGAQRTRARGSPGPLWDMSDGRMNLGLADFKNWTQAMDAVNLPELGRQRNLIPDIGRHSQNLRDVVHGLADSLPNSKGGTCSIDLLDCDVS